MRGADECGSKHKRTIMCVRDFLRLTAGWLIRLPADSQEKTKFAEGFRENKMRSAKAVTGLRELPELLMKPHAEVLLFGMRSPNLVLVDTD